VNTVEELRSLTDDDLERRLERIGRTAPGDRRAVAEARELIA